VTIGLRIDIGSCLESADSGGRSFHGSGSVLGSAKMKTRSQVQWQYSVLCVHNRVSTFRKIGKRMKIGVFIGNVLQGAADILL
jgi:hypothetical protein